MMLWEYLPTFRTPQKLVKKAASTRKPGDSTRGTLPYISRVNKTK